MAGVALPLGVPASAARTRWSRLWLGVALAVLWVRFAVVGGIGNWVAAEAALAALAGLSVLALVAMRHDAGARASWSVFVLASVGLLALHPHAGARGEPLAELTLGASAGTRAGLLLLTSAALACGLRARRGERPEAALALVAGGGVLYVALRGATGAVALLEQPGLSLPQDVWMWTVGAGLSVLARGALGVCCGLLGASEARARPLGLAVLGAGVLVVAGEALCGAALLREVPSFVVAVEVTSYAALLVWGVVGFDRLRA